MKNQFLALLLACFIFGCGSEDAPKIEAPILVGTVYETYENMSVLGYVSTSHGYKFKSETSVVYFEYYDNGNPPVAGLWKRYTVKSKLTKSYKLTYPSISIVSDGNSKIGEFITSDMIKISGSYLLKNTNNSILGAFLRDSI